MSKSENLYNLIHKKEILVMPGAYDALSAKLIEKNGFQACQITGFGVAASLFALPDIGVLSLRDQINVTQWISAAVNIPVMADGDTGYGNAVNTYHTVRLMEKAGAAGINLEDQQFPKKCGHMEGKKIIPMDEMVQKIKASIAAKKDPFFVINARTDAIAVAGIDEAIKRGNAYAKAGATLIFVEAPEHAEDIKTIVDRIDAPVSINMLGTTGGKSPNLSLKELQEIGVARVSYPILTLCSASEAIKNNLQHLKQHGEISSSKTSVMPFSEITDLVGLPFNNDLSQKFSS